MSIPVAIGALAIAVVCCALLRLADHTGGGPTIAGAPGTGGRAAAAGPAAGRSARCRSGRPAALSAIIAAASSGEEVTLAGFGRFKVADRAERQGRNPATGQIMTIAAAKKLAFTPAKTIRDALNVVPPPTRAAAE